MIVNAKFIAELVKGELKGNPEQPIAGVCALKDAKPEQLSFLGSKKFLHMLEGTHAGTIIVSADTEQAAAAPGRTLIVCMNVDYAFTQASMVFAVPAPKPVPGVHPRAVVDPSDKLGNNVSIGPCAVIEPGAEIGDNTVISAGCYIGHDVKIGANTLLYPNVTVMYRCIVGNKVIIHSGVVIGADGFGFVPGPQGLVKVPQTGIVRIDDDVEIGANTTIDRARFDKTWVKTNVKIDDQVMVAHNVTVGESSILVAQSGIAGSATLGRGVILAGKAGVNGHITLGDGTQVAGTSNVVKSTPPGALALGTPAEGQREYMTRWTLPSKVERLAKKIAELQAQLDELKK